MFSNKMLYIPDYVVYEDIPTIREGRDSHQDYHNS